MYIYKITNNINQKVYIGQSIRPVEDRFKRHISDAKNNILDTHFCRAIRKYGEENFSIEIIDTAQTQHELNHKEQYWIRYYNSIMNGYNETDAIYKSGGNTYLSKSKDEMSEIKEKLRNSKLGINNPNATSIKCLNVKTNEEIIFNTIKECKDYFGELHHRFITTRVTHQTIGLYKNEWTFAYLDDEYYYKTNVNKGGIKLIVHSLDNTEREYLESVNLLCKNYNLSKNQILNHINMGEKKFIINNYEIIILD